MRLAQRYQDLDDEGREALARAAGISAGYLWQLATGWRGKRPSVELLGKFLRADPLLTADDLVAEFAAEGAGSGADRPVMSHVVVSPLGAAG